MVTVAAVVAAVGADVMVDDVAVLVGNGVVVDVVVVAAVVVVVAAMVVEVIVPVSQEAPVGST